MPCNEESASSSFIWDQEANRLVQYAVGCRLIELGDDLLMAVALPRVHDQVVPNTTYVEHWSTGSATFSFPEDEIQVCDKLVPL